MKIYNYDYNGIYLGETEADKDPEIELQKKLGKKVDTVYLIPAYATSEQPPKFKEDECARYVNGKGWQVEKLPPPAEPVKPRELSIDEKRRAEYPDVCEYIEALALNDKDAQKAYLDKVKKVMDKYPKP